jgi:hypothetical protein
VCETPPYVSSDFERRKRSTGQNIHITYDDYQAISTIYYIDNPIFDQLPLIEYDKESTILITVKERSFFDINKKKKKKVKLIQAENEQIVENGINLPDKFIMSLENEN